MKTTIPHTITSIEQAKAFLSELAANNEAYHPEDNAHTIYFGAIPKNQWPNDSQRDQLNKLMNDIYKLNDFDPCEFLLPLI